MRRVLATMTALVVGLGLAACSSDKSESNHGQATGQATVVASTDVWGSVAGAIAGDHAKVKSILNSAVDDPHSYEASPADAAEIADASLAIFNGGGYDKWFEDALSNSPKVPTVNAYSLLPNAPQGANEHVFYDMTTTKAVASQIADRLASADPANAAAYRANAEEFGKKADEILIAERAIGQAHPGAAVAATEPVAHYLLAAAGITDKTPEGFANAVEQDTDPAPADLAAMLDLINTRQVAALVYNAQTQTALTEQLQDAAAKAGVPVVTVTETLPAGTDYLTWQRQTADQLAGQLDKAPPTTR